MLSIVIIGSGDVGRYMAEVLSKTENNVVVVDIDKKKLEALSTQVDIATRVGSGTDWQLLDDLLELSPDWLLSLTNDDETNLVACSIAKHLGYPNTIARVRSNHYLNLTRLDFGRIFDVDYFVGPELLVAQDMLKDILNEGTIRFENFSHGSVQLQTSLIPASWNRTEPLSKLELPSGVMIGLIKRGPQVIFPHGKDQILPGDEVTFIGEAEGVEKIPAYLNVYKKIVQSVVIVGGSLVGLNLAQLLEKKDIKVRLVEKDYDRCIYLADHLQETTILNYDATDVEFIREEKIAHADLIAFCTYKDETNILGAMLMKEEGAEKIVIMLSNDEYESIIKKLNISNVASPRNSAANRILSVMLSGSETSLISLYNNKAEVIEITVSADSKVVGIPISELGRLLPSNFLIAMIQNRGRIMVANGSRIISPGDTVIVITDPGNAAEWEKLF